MAENGNSKKSGTAHYEKASATLLSAQSPDPVERKSSAAEVKKWQRLRGHLENRLNSLRMWRTSWWNQNYSDLAQYIEPKRSIWLTQNAGGIPSPNNMSRGRPINNSIVDPTATYAVRVCASGLMSGLASPSRPWFKIVPSIKGVAIDAEGRAWIDEVEDRIYTVLAGSNFYNSFAQECQDLVVFGTAPVIIYEDEQDVLRCYNPVCGEYYLASSATMRVDGLYRAFVMTIEQIVDYFGVENCPADVLKMWEQKGGGLDTERVIGHSIEPNFGIGAEDAGKIPGKFSWRETYWVLGSGSEKPLSLRGFVEKPFTASRWSVQSNDAYGRSVGMDVLPDVIQLQVETMRKAEAIEKMVRPPLLASMELKNQPSSILPGHVTYVSNLSGDNGMRPIYNVNPQLEHMSRDLAEIQARIKQGFFNDIILLISNLEGDRRTATEVIAKNSERLQVLGPVIENIINESLKPRLKRVFGIMKRKNMLPEPPESMKDVALDIDFTSMLVLAQRAAATTGMERIAAIIGNLSAIYPEARHKLSVNDYINELNILLDNPEKIIRSDEDVAQILQQEAEAMQQQQQAAAMSQGMQDAKVGADAAKVLSETQVGAGRSALQDLMSGI